MRLAVHRSGSGPRRAVLIHGFNCDSGDWWELTPVLEDRGYRVEAVDLRGHGASPRAERYLVSDYASDVIESIEPGADLMMGHSLGGVVLGETVEALRPSRAVFLDPPWSPIDEETGAELFPQLDRVPLLSDDELRAELRRDFPRWSDRAIEADVASWRRWDPATGRDVYRIGDLGVPPAPVVPSLVVLADPSPVCSEADARLAAERGFEVRVARGLSHSLFRDDCAAFLSVVDDWV